ncbi:sodium-dependent transporter [Alkalicoccus daliensis]|uniref:Neurotransmitter:Na+ symporter, NSS family n=1 Tax=Alkalicoccus daliensis TaxID=745820 RepID=A0A1H0GVE1_9BACI|nr:sodium-dependent transporter [Alkalicoccus daliensis]SDO10870.1 neurotransmitter:Na+ symporter, NSS family [Alkalicoccus daliensis]
MNTENRPREQWGSRLGFMLAALGSAVGLGNIWRFSYVAGESGGAAFILIYLFCIAAIGLPILMAEFTIGRRAQLDVVGSFQKISPGKPWVLAGYMGVASAFIILSFYGVIAGWSMFYFSQYVIGGPDIGGEGGSLDFFVNFHTATFAPILWQFIFMLITVGIVYVGVKRGIEASNKILMPLLAILVLILAGYSMTLEGASEALNFLFTPDWSALTDPSVYLAALSQAFFSLSLGMGALITYGSYLSKKEKLPGAAVGVASMDSLFAIVAGLMIFPAVFTFGIAPDSGPGLVFIALPDIFADMSFGIIYGLLFFFLLTAAAISSGVSLLEVAVAYFMRKFEWSRQMTSVFIGTIIFLIGIPSSLGFGALADVTILGERDILDSMDFLASYIFLPLGGMIIALFIGWGWKKADALEASNFGDTVLGNIWLWIVRIFAPLAILIVFLYSTGIVTF